MFNALPGAVFRNKMWSLLKTSKDIKRLQSCGFIALRYLSTEAEFDRTDDTIVKRKRFAKRFSDKKLQPFRECFVKNLFGGIFDKQMLEYPSILQDEELDSLVKHSIEVENYLNDSVNSNGDLTTDVLKGLDKVELLGLTIPQEYGGLGYTVTESKFIQECAGVNPKIGRFIGHNEDFIVKILTQYGTEAQKKLYLPKIASGEIIGAIAYLEDSPLVDLKAVQTISFKGNKNNEFIISGKKKWVQNADLADIFIILTQSGVPDEDNEEVKTKLNFFIVEKNSPGLKVHKLKSSSANEFGLHELDLDNVFVPECNYIPTEDNTFNVLKSCLAVSGLSSAVSCLSLIKRIIHSTVHFCDEKKINETALQQFRHIQSEISFLTMYCYVLESIIYLVCGRLDTFEENDLFLDSLVAKVFAVDVLNLIVQKYCQIMGPDSYKGKGILEEAVKIMQHCSVFDENNSHLKLLIGSFGLIEAAGSLRKKVLTLKKPFDNPVEALKWKFSTNKKKVLKQLQKLNLKMDLHASLSSTADTLELNVAKFKVAVEEHMVIHGNLALEEEILTAKFAEMAIYLYAVTACLARASNSYCNCFKNSEDEVNFTILFGTLADMELEQLYKQIVTFIEPTELYRRIGQESFINKGYCLLHPLARTY